MNLHKVRLLIAVIFSIFLLNVIIGCPDPVTVTEGFIDPPRRDYTPQNFEVTIRDSDRLTFRWDPIDGVSSYKFYRKQFTNPVTKDLYTDKPKVEEVLLTEAGFIGVGSCDTHIFRDIIGLHKDVSSDKVKPLKPNTAYEYMIAMYDANKTALAKFKFTTVTGLDVPRDFMVSSKTEDTITVSWSKLDNTSDYTYFLSRAQRRNVLPVDILKVDEKSIPTAQLKLSIDGKKWHFTDKDLRKGGKYYYFLRTRSLLNKSYSSRQVEVMMDLTIPDSLEALYIPPSTPIHEKNCGTVKLTWNDVVKKDSTGKTIPVNYNVLISTQLNGEYTAINTIPLSESESSYNVTPENMGGTVYFRVKSIINGKESVMSAPAECSLPPLPCTYTDNSNKLIVKTGAEEMELKWINPKRADGVIIYNGTKEIARFYHLLETTYTEYNLTPNTKYDYRVVSFVKTTNADNKIVDTESVAISGSDYTNPLDVIGSHVVIDSSTDSVKITLPELSPTSLQYLITYREGTTGEYNTSPIRTNKTVTVVPMLKPLTTYNFKIDVANTTPNPDKTTVNPVVREITTCPAAPIDFKDVTTDATANSVTLTWKEPLGIDKSNYIIDYTIKCFDGTNDITESGITVSPVVEIPASSGEFKATVYGLPYSNKQYNFKVYTVASKSGVSLTSTDFASSKAYTCPKDLVEGKDLASGDLFVTSETDKIKIICDKPAIAGTNYNISFKKEGGLYQTLTITSDVTHDATGREILIFSHTGLESFTAYYYEISLENKYSKLKSKKTLEVGPVLTCPPKPTNLTVSNQTDKSVVLKWTEAAGITGYEDSYVIKIGATQEKHIERNNAAVTITGKQWEYTVTGLTSNTLYNFKVYTRFTESVARTSSDSTIAASVNSYTCPSKPRITSVVVDGNNIKITVDDLTKSYRVYLYSGVDFISEESKYLDVDKNNEITYNNARCFTDFKVRVVSRTVIKSSDPPDVTVLSSEMSAASEIISTTASKVSFSAKGVAMGHPLKYIVTLTWPSLSGISKYMVKRINQTANKNETFEFSSGNKDLIDLPSLTSSLKVSYILYAVNPKDGKSYEIGTVSANYPK